MLSTCSLFHFLWKQSHIYFDRYWAWAITKCVNASHACLHQDFLKRLELSKHQSGPKGTFAFHTTVILNFRSPHLCKVLWRGLPGIKAAAIYFSLSQSPLKSIAALPASSVQKWWIRTPETRGWHRQCITTSFKKKQQNNSKLLCLLLLTSECLGMAGSCFHKFSTPKKPSSH